MVKKNKFLLILLIISSAILINTGCKDFGVPEYNFIVTLGEGVSGTPEAGSYTYKELTGIEYEYIFTGDTERTPHVFLNDNATPLLSAGIITLYRDIEVFVGDVDIRGSWRLTITDTNENQTESSIVFSGATLYEGTFSDSDGNEGTWTNTSNVIAMNYTNKDNYSFNGSISPKFLSGNVVSNEQNIGTWSMVK